MEHAIEHSKDFVLLSIAAEIAGVFWILAEVAILLGLLHLRAQLDSRYLPLVSIKKLFLLTSIVVVTLYALTQTRYLFLPPLYTLPEPANADSTMLYQRTVYIRQFQLVLWGIYVTAWVFLEAAIVYQGIKIYRSLYHALAKT